jgi:hypothetical protein
LYIIPGSSDYRIEISPAADRDLQKLADHIRRQEFDRLAAAIDKLAADPRPHGVRKIADRIRLNMPQLESSGRIYDTWQPLTITAKYLEDNEWLEYAAQQIEMASREHVAGHGYEPDEATIYALQSVFADILLPQQSAKISTIKDRLLEEFGIKMKNYQVEQICIDFGFKVTKPHGYPTVQPDKELLAKLLENIHSEE